MVPDLPRVLVLFPLVHLDEPLQLRAICDLDAEVLVLERVRRARGPGHVNEVRLLPGVNRLRVDVREAHRLRATEKLPHLYLALLIQVHDREAEEEEDEA